MAVAHRLIRPLLAAVSIAAVSSMAACDGGTGLDEAEVVGQYALIALGDDALPAPPFPGSGTTIVADTLELRADGTGERRVRFREGDPAVTYIGRDGFEWHAVGDRLSVTFACDDTVLASCIAGPHLEGPFTAGLQWRPDIAVMYTSLPVYQRVGAR